MKCKIEIAMDNAAFDDPGELSRILREIADRADADPEYRGQMVRDINGNTVGRARIIGKRG